MSKTLEQLLASRSQESQERIQQLAEELYLEHQLSVLREKLAFSQQQLAQALDIKQPSLSAIEKRGNDIKVSTLKRYIEAMGGTMKIDVKLPTGEHLAFNV